jgi:Tfp pilus assembly protein PilF
MCSRPFSTLTAPLPASEATQKDPDNALAWARLSELYLSRGERSQALRAAQRAAELQPELAHTMTVLGFAYLAQIKTEKAKQAFTEAIASDSAAPMPRLGNGLAKIRERPTWPRAAGEIEIAACLDPGNAPDPKLPGQSLLRGKAR